MKGVDEDLATVFVKTSSRSAKDAPATQQTLITLYKQKIANLTELNDNSKLIALLEAQTETFKVIFYSIIF